MKNKFKTKIAFALLVALLSGCDTSNNKSVNNSTDPIGSASVTTPSVTLPDSNVPSVTIPSVTVPSTNPPVSNAPSVISTKPSEVSAKPSQSTSQTSTVVVEGKWQYFLQSDSSASRDFMRTPYIEGVTPSVDDSYYSSAFGKSGSSLLNSLKSIVGGSISRSYDWSRFEKVDEDPNNSSNVFCIYSRTSYGKSAHVSGNAADRWNREHTYPQSKISKEAANDSILIFADDWKTNEARGNYVFGEVTHNSSTAVKDSANRVTANYRQGSTFEPCDAAKGEVARATLYTYVVYGHSVLNEK